MLAIGNRLPPSATGPTCKETIPTSAPTMRPTRDETRACLIAGAYDVFRDVGIHDTAVNAICSRAGFTRGAFYSNFRSKEELFLALYREQTMLRARRFKGAVAELRVADPTTLTLSQAGKIVGDRFSAGFADDTEWYALNLEFRAYALRSDEMRAQVAEVQNVLEAALTSALDEVETLLDLSLPMATDRLAIATIALYESFLERTLLAKAPRSADPEDFVQSVVNVFSLLSTSQKAAKA